MKAALIWTCEYDNNVTRSIDGNGNLESKTDADYTYNWLDLVIFINYNDPKEVSWQYNATGDLIAMEDWLGETTFEVDLLHQLTVVTDHKGNQVEYTYDSMDRIREMRYYSGDGVLYMTHWVI